MDLSGKSVREMVDSLRRHHDVNDGDCWYTCPAATEEADGGRCCDDSAGSACRCGANFTNGIVDAILAALPGAIPPEHDGLPADWTPEEIAALDVLTKAWLAFTAACRPEIVNTIAIERNAVSVTKPGDTIERHMPGRVYTLSGVIVLPRTGES